jgi:hypothetical protein
MNLSNIKPNLKEERNGLDERFPEEKPKIKEIYRILKNYEKMEMLKKLQSNIPIQDKLDIIEKNDYSSTYKMFDKKAGGLMNDWEFEDFS